MFSHLIMGKARGSKEGEKHPYLRAARWADGTLCFWRDRPMLYTQAAHRYFESFVNNQLMTKKNVATIDANLK